MHGLHQTDVALLNQVQDVGPRAPVFHGDLHDQAEVRQYQGSGGLEVVVLLPPDGELVLLLPGDGGVLPQLRHVERERIDSFDGAIGAGGHEALASGPTIADDQGRDRGAIPPLAGESSRLVRYSFSERM
jgi:hypothetical protein